MKTYIYDENCNLIKTYFDGAEYEIRRMEGQKVYLSDKVFMNPIMERNQMREMTTSELIKNKIIELQEGEYLEKDEIITIEKPNNFHFWDTNLNKWVYDQELEKSSLEEEIGNLEGELSGLYDELDKAVARKLKMREKQLNEEIEKLNEKIENKYKRYEELED